MIGSTTAEINFARFCMARIICPDLLAVHRFPRIAATPHLAALDTADTIEAGENFTRTRWLPHTYAHRSPDLSYLFRRLCAKNRGRGTLRQTAQNDKINQAPEGPGVGPQARSATGTSMSGVESYALASEPFCGGLATKGFAPCPRKASTPGTRRPTSAAPAATTSRPAPPTRETSSSKSALPATRSSPASRSWSILPDASSASAASTPPPEPVRLRPPRSNSS